MTINRARKLTATMRAKPSKFDSMCFWSSQIQKTLGFHHQIFEIFNKSSKYIDFNKDDYEYQRCKAQRKEREPFIVKKQQH